MTIHERIAELEAAIDHDLDMGMRLEELDSLRADRNELVYVAALGAAESLYDFMGEASAALTCTEFESVLSLMEALGQDVDGMRTGSQHAFEDTDEDQHYVAP